MSDGVVRNSRATILLNGVGHFLSKAVEREIRMERQIQILKEGYELSPFATATTCKSYQVVLVHCWQHSWADYSTLCLPRLPRRKSALIATLVCLL